MAEARLERAEAGLVAATEGWFVVNVRDAAWVTNPVLGDACVFEGDEVPFPELGFTIAVLQPGQSGGRYHREDNQEDFLVLEGECLLLVESEERRLKTWDFVHCPPGTEHAFVGAGDGPCVIFMAGSRFHPTRPSTDGTSLRFVTARASNRKRTTHARRMPRSRHGRREPPESFAGLPWAPTQAEPTV